MNEEKIDYLISLLENQNVLLGEVLNTLNDGIHVKRQGNNIKYAPSSPLTQDDYDSLDEEIDLEFWYEAYGESFRPAKAMNQSGTSFSKQELDYMFRRLSEIASVKPEVNGGTHVFTSVVKKYCKEEKNTFNCFAMKPLNQ